jgi:hypothetical protein
LPHQVGLTVVAPVQPSKLDDLRTLLEEMGNDPAGNPHVPFGRVESIHYARFILLEPTADLSGRPIPAELIFMADFDSPLEAPLDRLLTVGEQGLIRLLSHCEGFPPAASRAACKSYFLDHATRDAAYYVNTVGVSADQVLGESRLHEALGEYLDATPELRSGDPATVRRRVADWVTTSSNLRWALQPPSPPELAWRIGELIHMVLIPLVGLVLLPVIIVALPFWLIALRLHERSEPVSTAKPDPGHRHALERLEDQGPVNQFTAVGFVKPGWFRACTARLVLFLIAYGVRHIFNRANLAGVKTIHFARWTYIDGGRRVIFASNYDGSVESYNDDFIDKIAWGLNAVFSNGAGFPSTRWLLWGGARNEYAFKNYLRLHQAPTQFWYPAYASLTALNIAGNAAIRRGLPGGGDETTWLLRL